MNGHAIPLDYAARLDAFRKSDSERDALVADLVKNYESLKLKYDQKCDDYNNEVESRRMWQNKANANERALNEHRVASGSNNFALCVLDGDGAVFSDYLYSTVKDGGAEAAHLLHTELKNQLKTIYPDCNVSDWSIVVQVILNLHGLGTKLASCNMIVNPAELVSFGRAFGQAHPLFSFIDVGTGKERADHKIRETLRLFLPNAQCKHVFFGPCHDNGYLPVLETYRRDPAIMPRLTLIETLPAEHGFTQLGLQRIRLPSIFRSQNLPGKSFSLSSPMQFRNASPATTIGSISFGPVPQKSPSPAPSMDSTSSNTWATVGKAGASGKIINVATKKNHTKKYVTLNVQDERLDERLPDIDSKAYQRFEERVKRYGKCCNNYHLNGKCEAGEYCDYNHGERLTPGEQLVLRHKAKSLSCPQKYACVDVNCFLGHHCKYGSACYLEHCRFADTHGQDLEPAKRLYEDGTEEWIPAFLEKFRH
ncbi:hypothetical protein M433DRAFT_88094 [Acidomyces richmondensis BFW]|nr:MAG: hypothetical protein FE78DRAFT_184655 [Acidomyces sp. 'richmondensis']KYG46177.1 hypothetical protein M433DRAFT_88094 [Acidomyces richmondensis BFW]